MIEDVIIPRKILNDGQFRVLGIIWEISFQPFNKLKIWTSKNKSVLKITSKNNNYLIIFGMIFGNKSNILDSSLTCSAYFSADLKTWH